MQYGRVEEATDVFARLEGKNVTINDPKILADRDEIVACVEEEQRLGRSGILGRSLHRRPELEHQPCVTRSRTLHVGRPPITTCEDSD